MDASHVYVPVLALGCFYSHISTGTFRRALTASLDRCTEIKSAPSDARSIAFRHLPPHSARFGYATEGTLFISAQLSVEGRMS